MTPPNHRRSHRPKQRARPRSTCVGPASCRGFGCFYQAEPVDGGRESFGEVGDQDSTLRQDDEHREPTDVLSQLQSACERPSEREVMRREAEIVSDSDSACFCSYVVFFVLFSKLYRNEDVFQENYFIVGVCLMFSSSSTADWITAGKEIASYVSFGSSEQQVHRDVQMPLIN